MGTTTNILASLKASQAEKITNAHDDSDDHFIVDSDEDFGVQPHEYGSNGSILKTLGVFASPSPDDRVARAFAESQGYKPKNDERSFDDDVYSNNY